MISHRPISGFLLRASKSTTSSSIARLVTMRCFSSSGDEIKTGTIKYYNYKDRYGFIIPDGVDKDSHDSKDLIFIHQNDIKKQECANEQNVYPVLRKDQRVAFKVSSPTEGVKRAKAFELTLENGDLIPPFEKNYLEKYTKRQKVSPSFIVLLVLTLRSNTYNIIFSLHPTDSVW